MSTRQVALVCVVAFVGGMCGTMLMGVLLGAAPGPEAPMLVQAKQFQLVDHLGRVRASILTVDVDNNPETDNRQALITLNDSEGRQRARLGVDQNGNAFLDLNGKRVR